MITAINQEIGASVTPSADITQLNATMPTAQSPMPVEIISDQSPLGLLQDIVLPLISPIASNGLVVIVIIFMLLEREDLRDRFIKLVGSNDLHRTTQVLQDAGQRVAQYLLVQLLVNVIYAIPIGIGLWLIGVPNAVLWGLLTLVLRFVPYIGSLLAAAFPLFLAFAVSPDWSMVIWTVSLFGTVELVTSNVIEPYLYGARTGVSPLAIIVSAIFWTWIWGPMGLVMSTPMTVCLVVLGRHVPQFEVFNILFGDDPILAPHARLYQRLLVGDGLEATYRAAEDLETRYPIDYYRDVGIPALLIAQNDHARGVLTHDQRRSLAEAAMTMVADLSDVVTEELAEMRLPDDDHEATANAESLTSQPLPGDGYRVLCIGGRSDLDDAAAAMLAQVLAAEGAQVEQRPHDDLAPSRIRTLATDAYECVVLTFLDPAPSRASFLHIRRIKRAAPHLRVGIMICTLPKRSQDGQGEGVEWSTGGLQDRIATLVPTVSDETLQVARDFGADFADTTLTGVIKATFTKERPVAKVVASRRPKAAKAIEQPDLATA
jgi:predicted PurR-regulated permease PerM